MRTVNLFQYANYGKLSLDKYEENEEDTSNGKTLCNKN